MRLRAHQITKSAQGMGKTPAPLAQVEVARLHSASLTLMRTGREVPTAPLSLEATAVTL